MPKRPNPYFEDFQPQIKIHIGFKEYHNTPDKMKSVYDKTIGILFDAANQKNNNDCLLKINTPIKELNMLKDDKRKTLKQLFFGKNMKLQHHGEIQVEKPVLCSLCGSRGAEAHARCSYCEAPRCTACCSACALCHRPTCSNCSITSFEIDNGVYCLSCC